MSSDIATRLPDGDSRDVDTGMQVSSEGRRQIGKRQLDLLHTHKPGTSLTPNVVKSNVGLGCVEVSKPQCVKMDSLRILKVGISIEIQTTDIVQTYNNNKSILLLTTALFYFEQLSCYGTHLSLIQICSKTLIKIQLGLSITWHNQKRVFLLNSISTIGKYVSNERIILQRFPRFVMY